MYINKLFLKEFGKFNNKEIKLDKGLNVLYGEPGVRSGILCPVYCMV